MHYSLLLCFTLHIVLTVITPISVLNITVQDFVNIRKAQDVLVLTVTMTECFILFFLQRIFQRCLVHLKYTKRLSTMDQLLNQCLMLQKVLRNLKAKPWGYDYTGVLVAGKRKLTFL